MVTEMTYKNVKGDYNQQIDTGFNNNRFSLHTEGSQAITLFAGYVILLSLAGVVFMCIKFGSLVIDALVIFFVVGGIALLALLGSTVVRHLSGTRAHCWIDRSEEEWHKYVYQVGPHTVVRNPYTREITVHNAAIITENRQYPLIEAPKEPNAQEGILTMWDAGSSAREIERHLNRGRTKDEKISYYQITKTLDLYRQGWNTVHKKAADPEAYPTDE